MARSEGFRIIEVEFPLLGEFVKLLEFLAQELPDPGKGLMVHLLSELADFGKKLLVIVLLVERDAAVRAQDGTINFLQFFFAVL